MTDIEYLHSDITASILKGFYSVCNILPFGLEIDVYRKALKIECEALGLVAEENKAFSILYQQTKIGQVIFDLFINNCVGLKIQSSLTDITDVDLTVSKKLLKLTPVEVMLLLNFGIEGHHKRLFLGNDFKVKYR